jgi:hypothetical protein
MAPAVRARHGLASVRSHPDVTWQTPGNSGAETWTGPLWRLPVQRLAFAGRRAIRLVCP